MFEKIIEKIEKYQRIIIHRHDKPDGDALGSQIGLKHLILENYPEKEVYIVGDSAGRFAFMEDSTPDEIPDEYYNGALAIILDTSAPHLIADKRYTLAEHTARLDHHLFVEQIADTELTDSSYESCCGLITELAIEAGYKINSLAAKSLYTGMVTDSGRFRYDSTTANTHKLAAKLLEAGFNTSEIYKNLYADDFKFIRLRAEFTLKIRFTASGTAYIYTTREELEATGQDSFSISRGMVGVMSEIRGVSVWVNFTETDEGVLAELRSNEYNVNPIAVKWGGGGHKKASGALLHSREDAMAMLSDLDELYKSEAN